MLQITFEQFYKYGKREYTDQNWHQCIAFMVSAIEDFKYFVSETEWCRLKCAKILETRKPKDLIGEDEDLFDIAYMYGHAQQALCLLQCKNDRFTSQRPPIEDPDLFEEFQQRKPYQYLQFCYWKIGNLELATQSAYTYLVANPKDTDALENVAFYMEQKNFKNTMLVDAMRMPYEEKYIKGVGAYNERSWDLCVIELEAAVEKFFEEEERCRKVCEDKLNWDTIEGINPEMAVIITSVYTSVLRCKTACAKKLSLVNGHDEGFILPKFYEYLHVCQYNLKRGRDACESVANSILLNPSNPMMRQNKYFYMKTYGKDDLFEPSPDIVKFYKRDVVEKQFLQFVDERFKYEDGELPPERQEDRVAIKLDIPIKDYFDYEKLSQPILSEAECGALSVAAIFEDQKAHQLHAVEELQENLNRRFNIVTKFMLLSCSDDQRLPHCKKQIVVVSLEKVKCGAFLSNREKHGCYIVYCIE